jgi:hypothetical protein
MENGYTLITLKTPLQCLIESGIVDSSYSFVSYVVKEYRRFELSREFVRIEHDEDLIG